MWEDLVEEKLWSGLGQGIHTLSPGVVLADREWRKAIYFRMSTEEEN